MLPEFWIFIQKRMNRFHSLQLWRLLRLVAIKKRKQSLKNLWSIWIRPCRTLQHLPSIIAFRKEKAENIYFSALVVEDVMHVITERYLLERNGGGFQDGQINTSAS